MRSDKIIYKLMVEDIQTVAEDTIERKLTDKEINSIIDDIAMRISWYDAIDEVISEKIKE